MSRLTLIAAAALRAAVLLLPLFPRHVTLEWDNPDPNVPHGTAEEIQMSVDDAAVKYQLALLIGPLVGAACGAIGGGFQTFRSARPARLTREPSLPTDLER